MILGLSMYDLLLLQLRIELPYIRNVDMLCLNGIVPSKLPNGFVPVDIDVTPFDNSKSHKQGGSRTYKGFDGYAPIMAYIGTEGYLINAELREGKQHCQRNTPEFLCETIQLCRQITLEPLLFRLDSGNDAAENIGILIEAGCSFIIKRNLRRESTERTIDKYGQFLLPSEIEVNTWWTNIGLTNEEVIGLYHAHGECEQYHSEIKTDIDVGRLPSGKFATNALVIELTILSYNILRMIDQESIGRRGTQTRHKVRRRRLRTVISNLIMMAGYVTTHARQLVIGVGHRNVWRYAFAEVYTAFADFRL